MSKSLKLSKNQYWVLLFIERHVIEFSCFPSQEVIRQHMGFKWRQQVSALMKELQDKGYIKIGKYGAQSHIVKSVITVRCSKCGYRVVKNNMFNGAKEVDPESLPYDYEETKGHDNE